MKALEDDTDYKLRTVKESELNLMEIDEPSLRQNLKDRQHGNDYINDVEENKFFEIVLYNCGKIHGEDT